MNEHISRPPFDENGYAAYEGQSKKKSITPLRWIIPAGLLLIVAVIVLIIRFRPKEPGAFCRAAIKDAVTDSFGGGDPLIKALGLDDVRKMLESRDFTVDTVVAVQSIEAEEGTDLYDLVGLIGMKPEDIPSGIGLGVTVESRKDQGFHAKLAVTLSSIRLVLLRFWGNDSQMTVGSQRLAKEGLTFSYRELFDTWYDNPGWSLVPEEDREETKDDIRDFLTKYKILSILSRFIDGNSPLEYIGTGYDEAMDKLLSRIRFSEAKNASGRRVQEKFHVGGEYILSYGYHAEIDAEEICKRIRSVAGFSADEFKPANGAETIEAMLYITRRGELISIAFETEIDYKGKSVPFSFVYEAGGDLDPQDHFTINVKLGLGEDPIAITIAKDTVKNPYGIRSRWDGALQLGESSYAIQILSDFDPKSDKLNVTAKTFWNGASVGGLEAEGDLKADEEYSLNFRKMKFWDTFSGATLNLTWKILVSPKEDSFTTEPPKTLLDVNHMSEEEWNAFYEEVKENLDSYLEYIGDLF